MQSTRKFHVTSVRSTFMRKSRPASASAASESDLLASTRVPVSAMTLAQALPTTAIPESTALLHIASAPALQQPCPIPASRVRGA
eukprot:5978472-Prymnesium_polylepis.1